MRKCPVWARNGPHGSMVRCNAGLGGETTALVVVVVVLLPPQSGVVCCCECCFDLGPCFSEDVCRSSCAPLAILRSFVHSSSLLIPTQPPPTLPTNMKLSFTTLASVALALAACPVAQAIAPLGFNLGVKDNSGACKTADDYADDFDALSPYSSHVKVYSVSDCNTLEILGPAAESAGFQLTLGVWPTPEDKYTLEKQTLQQYLPTISKSTVSSILVGSEALYRGDLTGDELASYISEVKSLLADISDKDGQSYSDVPVGTVDSWNILVSGEASAPIKASDVLYANAFSYWQGQTQANSTFSFFDDIMQALQTIQTAKGSADIDFWVGETGWPTEGSSYGSSVPSVDNAKTFWQEGVCAMRGWGVNTFVFEAFDESWKPETSGSSVEPYWGVFTDERSLKYSLDCSF